MRGSGKSHSAPRNVGGGSGVCGLPQGQGDGAPRWCGVRRMDSLSPLTLYGGCPTKRRKWVLSGSFKSGGLRSRRGVQNPLCRDEGRSCGWVPSRSLGTPGSPRTGTRVPPSRWTSPHLSSVLRGRGVAFGTTADEGGPLRPGLQGHPQPPYRLRIPPRGEEGRVTSNPTPVRFCPTLRAP